MKCCNKLNLLSLEERNVRKIQLRVSELDSPCTVVSRSPADKKRKIDKQGSVAVGRNPRSLHFTSNTSETSLSDTIKGNACIREENLPLNALEKFVKMREKKLMLKNPSWNKSNLKDTRHFKDWKRQSLLLAILIRRRVATVNFVWDIHKKNVR